MRKYNLKLGIALLALLPCAIFSQVSKARFIQNAKVIGGIYFQTWGSENDDQVSEVMIPLVYVLPFDRRLSFDVSTGPVFASLNTVGSGLNGLSDTRL